MKTKDHRRRRIHKHLRRFLGLAAAFTLTGTSAPAAVSLTAAPAAVSLAAAPAAATLTAAPAAAALAAAVPAAALALAPAAVYGAENTEAAAPAQDPQLPAAYYEPAQTDSLPGWPQGPAIYAESGILVDLDTQEILYSKNMDKQLYPASITKIMTTLVAIESSSAEEPVTFSQHALDSIEWDSSNIGCRLNETLTMEQCWYAMLLNSANEVCCGVAEHVSGSIEAFVDRMNQKAAELGCTSTHFSNTNGLPDENHYTTAHDMALIANAAYQNETFRQVFTTRRYDIPPTPQYTETRYLYNHHKMMQPDTDYYYDGCLGGKTGYTEAALNTLVTLASRNGKNLLCVTMRTAGRQVYTDTASLFDYGFSQTFPAGQASLLTVPETAAAGGNGSDNSDGSDGNGNPSDSNGSSDGSGNNADGSQDSGSSNGNSDGSGNNTDGSQDSGSSSSSADGANGSGSQTSDRTMKKASVFPVWIPLTVVLVIAAGLVALKVFLQIQRNKRRRRRRRRRKE